MHSELECYLVAEGSFANGYKRADKVVVEEGIINYSKLSFNFNICSPFAQAKISAWNSQSSINFLNHLLAN